MAAPRHLRHKTLIFAAAVVIANVCGNLMLSMGMHRVGRTVGPEPLQYLHALLNPWVTAGVCFLAVWLFSQLSLLSWADLSYVLPVTATAYVLAAIAGHFLLGEHIAPIRWVGIACITVGAAIVGRTTPVTTLVHPAEDEEIQSGKPRVLR